MRNLLGLLIALICLAAMLTPAHAAKQTKASKATQPTKERLVLMPLRLGEEDKNLQGAMETALVKGLQQKYEVFSGEQVAKKAREIFLKESRNTAKKECDETRCLQGIAEYFQAELLATANVTKQDGGYFLALSIQNLFDNKVVYSESLTCEGCNAFKVVEKLKELVGVPVAIAAAPANEEPQPEVSLNDAESALWGEVQKGNSADDYTAYLAQYPKGKYVALANSRIKKLKDEAATETAQQEQSAWESANSSASEAGYQDYLSAYPKGRYATPAKARLAKLKKEEAKAAAKDYAQVATGSAQQGEYGADKQEWDSANKTATEGSYLDYLRSYPQGRYAKLAQARMDQMAAERNQRDAEEDAWEYASRVGDYADYLAQYPKGKYAVIAKNRIAKLKR